MIVKTFSGSANSLATEIAAEAEISFLSVHCNAETDISILQMGGVASALHGASSCLGAMTQDGTTAEVAAFALIDPDGAFGTAVRDFGQDPVVAAQQATRAALANADRTGERPELIWVSATPGCEEEVLAGIESIVGDTVPIIGGSAADNTVVGDWFVFDGHSRVSAGLDVSVLFPSGEMSFAYQSGYAPTQHAGTVTRCTGRTIHEIDHLPALDVYQSWTDGAVPVDLNVGGTQSLLAQSTLTPLGREVV